MRVKKIHLFKSELDKSYKSVLDFHKNGYNGDYKLPLLKWMTLNYDNIQIQPSQTKGLKTTYTSASITLNIEFRTSIGYNYCVIEGEDDISFYFIENSVSLNDNPDNPSTIFSLLWDSWNNNINSIMSCKSINNISVKHYDRFVESSSAITPRRIYSPEVSEVVKSTEYTDFKYDDMITNLYSRYRPIYLVVEYKNFPRTDDETLETREERDKWLYNEYIKDGIRIQVNILDSLNGKYPRNLQYFIVGMYDVKLGRIADGWKVTGSTDIYYSDADFFTKVYEVEFNEDLNVDDIDNLNGAYFMPNVNGAYLSFNPPFKFSEYVINEGSKTISFTNMKLLPTLVAPVILGKYVATSTVQNTANTFIVNYPQTVDFEVGVSGVSTININTILGYRDILINDGYFNGTLDASEIDPVLYSYPFKYASLIYGSSKTNLTNYNVSDSIFKIKLDRKTPQTVINILDENSNSLIAPSNIMIDMPKYISTGENALDYYLAYNGSQYQTSKNLITMQAVLNGANTIARAGLSATKIGMASNLIAGAIGMFALYSENAQLDAKINDLNNAPHNWSASTGECDLWYQDRLALIVNECYPNSVNRNKIIKLINMYGYPVDIIDDVFSNNRYRFDYCQTVDCCLQELIVNNYDKEVLKNVFDTGVTKWHILLDDEGEIDANSITSLNYDYIRDNIESKFRL